MVMTMASVSPGKESMREYFSDFTSQTDDLIKKLETHTDLFSKKTSIEWKWNEFDTLANFLGFLKIEEEKIQK